MPAEQEVRGIANDAVEHDGWLDPVDMMRLARAYLALEAELLAAQERAEKAEYDALMANKVVEANSVARWQSVETKKAQRVEAELAAAQEREQENFEAMMDERQKAIDSAEREKALRAALMRIRAITLDVLLAGSPSEKPGSEEEACPRCGATPDGGTSLDCPVCTGVTDAD